MTNVDALIHARWIIPIEPYECVLENHTLAIQDSRLIDCLPSKLASQRYQSPHCYNRAQHIVMPGLINTHTHASMNLMRGIADDMALSDWLEKAIWPIEQRMVNEDFVRDGAEHAIAEMLRAGTTCFNDMYFFPNITAQVVSACAMRAMIGLIVLDAPTAWGSGPDDYLAKAEVLAKQYHNHPLISTALAPHAPYTVSNSVLERVQALSQSWQCPIHMHIHETNDEIKHSLNNYQCRPLERLDKLGVLSNQLIAVHMAKLADSDFDLITQHQIKIAHCPQSNAKLGNGFCPIDRLQKQGATIALGTDGAASNNDLDMFDEMRSAVFFANGAACNAKAVSAADALHMATLGGAQALGLEREIGSLAIGKAADIIAIDMGSIETTPLYNPISQVVYASSREQVTDVWVAGRHLLKDRQCLTLDTDHIMAKAAHWQKQLGQL